MIVIRNKYDNWDTTVDFNCNECNKSPEYLVIFSNGHGNTINLCEKCLSKAIKLMKLEQEKDELLEEDE